MRYLIIAACAGLLALSGCNQRQQAEANDAAQRAKVKSQQAIANAKRGLDNAGMTMKVKSAMNSSDKLNTSGINVDTVDRVVYLKGKVASAEQKALAERIANDTVGPDVRVMSQLKIDSHNK